jgi:malate dehydrogenase
MDIAVIGAAGSCGRQFAAQVLERELISESSRLQLVGHRGGLSERELFGLRADLEDAFVDRAPTIEVALDPEEVSADLWVMLAGRTISTDPSQPIDRVALGRANLEIFERYAAAIDPHNPPIVIVQSNPVELGVEVFGMAAGRHRVLGAGARSDTLRFRQEIAVDLGVRRPQVTAFMIGQHGDNLVPLWSSVRAEGVPDSILNEYVERSTNGRDLAELPLEIKNAKARMAELVRADKVVEAYDYVSDLTADVRAAVKPFFTHFTAGHTTEMATAHAVADIVAAIAGGHRQVMAAQVTLDGEWLDLVGTIAVPILTDPQGWSHVMPLEITPSEREALLVANRVVAGAHTTLRGGVAP